MQATPERILDYREYPVLYVDDDAEVLRIFELGFRREFSVLTARSAEEALARLHATPIALVLADHRIAGMTGIELLERAHEADPRTVRMLVTTHDDAETLGRAINHVAVSRFVPKPWTPDALRETLRHGVEGYALEREREQLLRELTLQNRVARSMTRELALSALMDLTLSTVVEDLGFDAAAILFFAEAGGRLCWERFAPGEDEVSDALRRIELTPRTAPAFLRRLCNGEAQVLMLDQALHLEGAMRRWVTEVAAEEILVVPLLGREQAFGALALDNRRGGRHFTADDQTLLEGVASQAAIALENARLIETLRASRDGYAPGATLGALAAGLAHELNNPLVSIQTFVQLAPGKRGEPDTAFWGDFHGVACQELERIRTLVATLQRLGPGAGGVAPPEPLDLLELATEVAAQLRPDASSADLTLVVRSDPQAPKVLAVREALHQALGHLVRNAIQASPPGAEVAIQVAADPGGGASLEVRDDGEGIPEENLARVFEPFFTTRRPGRGSGLGLALCQKLLSDCGGTVEVRSREGEGSSFRVRLPAASRGSGS
jgi:signal transduction histidine kinase/DNA-binding NarL/FixJ family response regulator